MTITKLKTGKLSPHFESVKSYYNKSSIEVIKDLDFTEETPEMKTFENLYSYNTLVATHDYKENKIYLKNTHLYSNTTLRHVKEWLQQKGFKKFSKKELFKEFQENTNKNLLLSEEQTQ